MEDTLLVISYYASSIRKPSYLHLLAMADSTSMVKEIFERRKDERDVEREVHNSVKSKNERDEAELQSSERKKV